eukprot:TRINITY_DN132828_c1_g1_i1.p1 TRINITY_DN132828_c1_g1~~TRINITY_DN132828_c1_g1_i1.p1  ORF type:complete len:493 (+),score=118.90 TRINITY_DN132828_c1_g1_i1:101-1579(+)
MSSKSLKFKTHFRNTIYDVFKKRNWKETESDDWNIIWADRDWIRQQFDSMHFNPRQRINHYRNSHELCRKDHMIKNLKKQKRLLIKDGKIDEANSFNFYPTTFVLPTDYALFVEEFKRESGRLWIMKPIGKSQGRGIFIFQKLSDISKWKTDHRWKSRSEFDVESYVVQEYIFKPCLVGCRKFDIRIYALVTSFSPLEVFLARTGFARFSNSRYSSDLHDLENAYVHLTNVAIQKHSDSYDKTLGGKWPVRDMKLHFMSKYGVEKTEKLFVEIQMIVIRSLQAVQKVMINDKHCFELFGYDIMFDADLKPWLLEVNASPSLSASTKEDHLMKCSLLSDMLDILDVEQQRPAGTDISHCGCFDLIYRDGPIPFLQNARSLLGCDPTTPPPRVTKLLAMGSAGSARNNQGTAPSSAPGRPRPTGMGTGSKYGDRSRTLSSNQRGFSDRSRKTSDRMGGGNRKHSVSPHSNSTRSRRLESLPKRHDSYRSHRGSR